MVQYPAPFDNIPDDQLALINAEIAENIMSLSLTPPLEFAMAKVAWRHIIDTGPQFTVQLPHAKVQLTMPAGEFLRQPEGSVDWNDRYALYVAKQFESDFATEVAAYRTTPPLYSTSLIDAFSVLEKWPGDYELKRQNGIFHCELFIPSMQYASWGKTIEVAICLAAISASRSGDFSGH